MNALNQREINGSISTKYFPDVLGHFLMGRGAYMRHLKLPLGMSDFEEIRQNGYYYIDKVV